MPNTLPLLISSWDRRIKINCWGRCSHVRMEILTSLSEDTVKFLSKELPLVVGRKYWLQSSRSLKHTYFCWISGAIGSVVVPKLSVYPRNFLGWHCFFSILPFPSYQARSKPLLNILLFWKERGNKSLWYESYEFPWYAGYLPNLLKDFITNTFVEIIRRFFQCTKI